MRIGETLKLRARDFDFNKNPVEVSIRGEITKTGNRRRTFISSEAKESISQWLRVREDYIKSSRRRDFGAPRDISGEDRLFPFSTSTARELWNRGLKKAGLDEQDSRTKYHIICLHSLRKYFKTQLSKSEGAGEMPDGLLGHIDTYLRYSLEDFREFYTKAEHTIAVFGGADLRELSENREAISELKDTQNRHSLAVLELLEDLFRLKDFENCDLDLGLFFTHSFSIIIVRARSLLHPSDRIA